MKDSNQSGLWIVAIVAVVGVVAMVSMIKQGSPTYVPTMASNGEGLSYSGQAVFKQGELPSELKGNLAGQAAGGRYCWSYEGAGGCQIWHCGDPRVSMYYVGEVCPVEPSNPFN